MTARKHFPYNECMRNTITFRLESHMQRLLEDLAEDTGRTQSDIIRQAIHDFIIPLRLRRMRDDQDRQKWLTRNPRHARRP